MRAVGRRRARARGPRQRRGFLDGAADAQSTSRASATAISPGRGRAIKDWFETLKGLPRPDLILTHTRDDRHQDHREVCALTWNTFRDHLILEYEIPKWDGDLGRPSVYVPISEAALERKVELLHHHFPSQATKPWFDRDTFRGLARLRGLESASPTRFAEAFYAPKLHAAPERHPRRRPRRHWPREVAARWFPS